MTDNVVAVISRQSSTDQSVKYAFQTADRATFEAVRIWEGHRREYSLCMSAQAGCAYGCTHCATTFARTPFVRSLTAAEILAAADHVVADGGPTTAPLSSVDFSGIGDSAANWGQVVSAASTILDRTVARIVKVTSIAPKAWARWLLRPESWLPDFFVFSLHGADVAQRRVIIPRADDPHEVLPIWREIAEIRPVVLNYVLCEHNTRTEDAQALVRLLAPYAGCFTGLRLASFNPVPGSPLAPSGTTSEFVDAVRAGLEGWEVARHRSVGRDVRGACGQMRSSLLDGARG